MNEEIIETGKRKGFKYSEEYDGIFYKKIYCAFGYPKPQNVTMSTIKEIVKEFACSIEEAFDVVISTARSSFVM